MRWRELRPGQKEILEELLAQRPVKFIRPLLCASLRLSKTERKLHADVLPISEHASGQTSGHVSIAEQKYTPATRGSSLPSDNTQRSQLRGTADTQQLAPAISGYGFASSATILERDKKLWAIFGVEGPRMTPEVDEIGSNNLKSDGLFLRELRRKHHLLRGRLRSYFSILLIN